MPIANGARARSFNENGLPTHPYHMMAESRPLYPLFRLVRTPLRERRRYHAHSLLDYASIANSGDNRRLHMYDNRKLRSSKLFERSGPSYTPIPYDGRESTSIPPASPIQDASSTIATEPRPSIAKIRIIRRLHMYENGKLRSRKLFEG